MEHLFVYGTLIPGQKNEFVLKKISGNWQKATTKGLFDKKGWSKTNGFPAIILDKNGEIIPGFLFSSDELTEHWNRIDYFETSMYQRVLTTVFLENGTEIMAYIYELNSSLAHGIQSKK
jgi:gamma-glutamylcyclotransferase (GGCT)/AIG2-like uncharacterized protein YtfP